jgi:Protein of unknown function (DUF1579)
MKPRMSLGLAVVCVFAGGLLAQESKMPQPGPEHKRIAYLGGHWTSEGEMKPGPFGPGGKMTATDHNEWFPGGFFLVIHSAGTSPMGAMHEMAIIGYNAAEKVYTYDGFSSMGEHEIAKGTIEGGTWTWTSEDKAGGKTVKGRYIMRMLSPTSYTFKYDYSTDGTTKVK